MSLKLIMGVGPAGEIPQGTVVRINTYNYKLKSYCVYMESNILTGTGINFSQNILSLYKKAIIFKCTPISGFSGIKIIVFLEGNFNFDSFSVETGPAFTGRVELRNDDDVLITDNGKPWGDGTYPPDAKNRAGLAGLHAAPAVINPELETALMGDETDKERVQE